MNHQINMPNRIFRVILGVILLTWALAGGPIWTFGGLYFIYTAASARKFIWPFFHDQHPANSTEDQDE